MLAFLYLFRLRKEACLNSPTDHLSITKRFLKLRSLSLELIAYLLLKYPYLSYKLKVDNTCHLELVQYQRFHANPPNFVLFTVIRCGYPGHLLNGHVIGRSYLFGDVIHYSCHEGYKLQGSKSRQCNEHGFWTGVRPACKGKR